MRNGEGEGGEPSIAVLLRQLRMRAGWTQRELAEAGGVSDGMIGNVERGTRNLGYETLERMADALKLADDERAALRDARKRFGSPEPAGKSRTVAPWDELLAEQRRTSDQLERLADLLEADLSSRRRSAG